jgi:hypothetical protein
MHQSINNRRKLAKIDHFGSKFSSLAALAAKRIVKFGAGRRPAEQNFDYNVLPDRAVTAESQCVSLAYFAKIVL